MCMTSTGCGRSGTHLSDSVGNSAGRHELLCSVLLIAVHRGLEHLAPAGHLRVAAQQRPPFALRHAAPHTELDAVVEGIGEAFVPNWAAAANPLRHVLLGALHEERVRVAIATCRHTRPVDDHGHISTSPLGLLPGPFAVVVPVVCSQTTSPHGIRVQFAGPFGRTAKSPATGTPRVACRIIMLCSHPTTQRCSTRLTALL